jgi:hypothetical protein
VKPVKLDGGAHGLNDRDDWSRSMMRTANFGDIAKSLLFQGIVIPHHCIHGARPFADRRAAFTSVFPFPRMIGKHAGFFYVNWIIAFAA